MCANETAVCFTFDACTQFPQSASGEVELARTGGRGTMRRYGTGGLERGSY
jgi:hypothetical protein